MEWKKKGKSHSYRWFTMGLGLSLENQKCITGRRVKINCLLILRPGGQRVSRSRVQGVKNPIEKKKSHNSSYFFHSLNPFIGIFPGITTFSELVLADCLDRGTINILLEIKYNIVFLSSTLWLSSTCDIPHTDIWHSILFLGMYMATCAHKKSWKSIGKK